MLRALDLDPTAFSNDRSGFAAGLYRKAGTDRYALAFRGTEVDSAVDWGTDGANAFGARTDQYAQALKVAGMVADKLGDHDLTMTGHSLGGGLASLASLATGVRGVTFNAAGLPNNTEEMYGVSLRNNESLIRAYHLDGEVLTTLQTSWMMDLAAVHLQIYSSLTLASFIARGGFAPITAVPEAVGSTITLPAGGGNLVQKHGMDHVIPAMTALAGHD